MNNPYISPPPELTNFSLSVSPLAALKDSQEDLWLLFPVSGLFILQLVFGEEWIVLGKVFGPAMASWNLKHKEKIVDKSRGGIPSEGLFFRGLVQLLVLEHYTQIAKACPALQLPLLATRIML